MSKNTAETGAPATPHTETAPPAASNIESSENGTPSAPPSASNNENGTPSIPPTEAATPETDGIKWSTQTLRDYTEWVVIDGENAVCKCKFI